MSSGIEIPDIDPDASEHKSDLNFDLSALGELGDEELFRLKKRRVAKLFARQPAGKPREQFSASEMMVAIRKATLTGIVPIINGLERVVDEETGRATHRIGPTGVDIFFPPPPSVKTKPPLGTIFERTQMPDVLVEEQPKTSRIESVGNRILKLFGINRPTDSEEL